MTVIWYMVFQIWSATDKIFLSFWTIFCPFTQKNQNFEKLKKAPGDIIILHKCTKNDDYMLYCSLDMARNRLNCYFSFWAIFYPFTSLTVQKIKIEKKWKKPCGDIIILHKSTKNDDQMIHSSWDMVHDGCNYFSFWAISDFEKIQKTHGDIIILHRCTKNYGQMMYSSWDMLCDRWTDRWTDGQRK